MNFEDIDLPVDWVPYAGQSDRNVTYVFMASTPISRLRSESNILYIGKTVSPIRVRYRQETETNNTGRNTQNTNIRTTYVFRQIRPLGIIATCHFVRDERIRLPHDEAQAFAEKLKTWDKQTYVKSGDHATPTIEKFLLVTYAEEHLELPPLNNRF